MSDEPAQWGTPEQGTEKPGFIDDVVHPPTGTIFWLDRTVVWSWYATIKALGIDQAYAMATAALTDGNLAMVRMRVRWMLEAIQTYGTEAKDRETLALDISYRQRSANAWTRAQAHRFAQNVFDPDLTETAWRLRVLRYAKQKGLPPLAKGRPPSKK